MKASKVLVVVAIFVLLQGTTRGQQNSANQWPNYQHNSNFSPLTQITPANVGDPHRSVDIQLRRRLPAESGGLVLDYRFEVQPLLIGGVMYISTPASQRDPNLRSP